MQQDQDSRPSVRPHVLRPALALTAFGLPGLLSLLPALPEVPGVPPLALLVNPLIFLVLAALLGSWLAPRCGFRSRIAERLSGTGAGLLPRAWGKVLLIGGALGVAVTLADHALGPLWQERPSFPPSLVEAWGPTALLLGVFYGGVVEEIVMRWGLMSLLVWLAWRLLMRRASQPPRAAVLFGLLAAAAIFAASHLPTLANAGAEMTAPLLARTLGFNFALGLAFGFLFARRSLEAAMLAHIGFHLGVACTALPMLLVF
jgi:hypothetical protein